MVALKSILKASAHNAALATTKLITYVTHVPPAVPHALILLTVSHALMDTTGKPIMADCVLHAQTDALLAISLVNACHVFSHIISITIIAFNVQSTV